MKRQFLSSFFLILIKFILSFRNLEMERINWYMNLYYKYRQYPIQQINSLYKRTQLRTIYYNILLRLHSFFNVFSNENLTQQVDHSKKTVTSNLNPSQRMKSGYGKKSKNEAFEIKQINSDDDFSSQTMVRDYMKPKFTIPGMQKERITIEGDLIPTKAFSKFTTILKNLNKELFLKIIIKIISEEELTNQIKSTGNFLSVSSSMDRNSYPSSSTTIDLKDEDIEIEEQKYSIPQTNNQIKFYFLKYISELPIESQPCLEKLKVSEDKFMLALQNLWENQLSFYEDFIHQFYESIPPFMEFLEEEENILITTWLELLLLSENFQTLYSILQELVLNTHGLNNPFIDKINSYLHSLTLLSTKKIFAEMLSKYNFFSMIPDFVNQTKSISQINIQIKKGVVFVEDLTIKMPIYNKEGLQELLKNWRQAILSLSEVYSHNPRIFWARIFEDFLILQNKYASQKMSFAYTLLVLYENLDKISCQQKLKQIIFTEILNQSTLSFQDSFNKKIFRIIRANEKKTSSKGSMMNEQQLWQRQIKDNITFYQNLNELLDLGIALFENKHEEIGNWFVSVYEEIRLFMKEGLLSSDKLNDFLKIYKKEIIKMNSKYIEEKEFGRINSLIFQLREHEQIFNQNTSLIFMSKSYYQPEAMILKNFQIETLINQNELEGSANVDLLEKINENLKLTNILNSNSFIYHANLNQKKLVQIYLTTEEVVLSLEQKMNHSKLNRSRHKRQKNSSLILKRQTSSFEKDNSEQTLKIQQKLEQHNECLDAMLRSLESCKHYFYLYGENNFCTTCSHPKAAIADKIELFLTNYKKNVQENHHAERLSESLLDNKEEFQKVNELFKIRKKSLYINCLISSLKINTITFQSIKCHKNIKDEKFKKIKVIGKQYFLSVHQMMSNKGCFSQIDEFEEEQLNYEINFLLIINALIDFLFDVRNNKMNISSYRSLMFEFFSFKIMNIVYKYDKFNSDQFVNFAQTMEEMLQWNNNVIDHINEEKFLIRLEEIRIGERNQAVLSKLQEAIESQFVIIEKCEDKREKLQFLDTKLFYTMLRQLYFYLYYQVCLFDEKPEQARRNYKLYEQKIEQFFLQITQKDKQEFLEKKKAELKQRSIHLKGYLPDYEKEPPTIFEKKIFLMKIICVFDQILHLSTESKFKQMKKKRFGNNLLTHEIETKKQEPLYLSYISTQYKKPNKQSVKTFSNTGFNFYQAIRIYDNLLKVSTAKGCRRFSSMSELPMSFKKLVSFGVSDDEIIFLEKNKESLISLWKNEELQTVCQHKVELMRKNFVSKVQKLYIDLDVRHKVFQSFKNKILGFEMHKTKIYHQYMDYIRGLKLDVYAHIGGDDPIPYFKLVNGIKFFRLKIKEEELEKKMNKQFVKNLSKWNSGIIDDLFHYEEWVRKELKYWKSNNENEEKNKKQLYEIYDAIQKELRRQCLKLKNEKENKSTPKRQIMTSKPKQRKYLNKNKSVLKFL